MRLFTPIFLLSFSVALSAASENDFSTPRVSAQLLFGTAGFEPGLAAEWRIREEDLALAARPEVFVNKDGKVGGGAFVGWGLEADAINKDHDLTIGPRVVYHNADDYGWEAAAAAIYSFPIGNEPANRHFIQVIGAAGIVENKKEDDTKTTFGGTLGAAYAFQF